MITPKLVDGNCVFVDGVVQMLEEREALRQRLIHKLSLQKGEFLLAPDEGVNWKAFRASKILPIHLIKGAIQKVLRGDSEVDKVNSIVVSFNNETRELFIAFDVDSTYGIVRGDFAV